MSELNETRESRFTPSKMLLSVIGFSSMFYISISPINTYIYRIVLRGMNHDTRWIVCLLLSTVCSYVGASILINVAPRALTEIVDIRWRQIFAGSLIWCIVAWTVCFLVAGSSYRFAEIAVAWMLLPLLATLVIAFIAIWGFAKRS